MVHKKKTRGRPPLPADIARSERVVTFVTRTEIEILTKLSAAEGKTLSALCHDLLVDSMATRTTTYTVSKGN